MRPPVFLTGATGFLGMEVLARLLEAGDREVIVLVRAADDGAAAGARSTACSPSSGAIRRSTATACARWPATSPATVSASSAAQRTALAEDIGAIMHCAASISFDMPLDEARAINVEGTREMIGFARECKSLGRLERFVHVSTAYVSGKHEGTFRERQLDAGQEFRNTYEQTKWEAEHIVREATDLAPAIARPSIVMGESDTGWTPAFNVLYWPLRAFSRGLFDEIPALPTAHVDIVPVDYVADALVRLLDVPDQGVFNLVAGREAPFANELVELACDRFDRPRPEVVAGGGLDGRRARRGLHAVLRHGGRVRRQPARRRCWARPGSARRGCSEFFGALMDYAEEVRWGKRAMTREEARERFSAAPAAA